MKLVLTVITLICVIGVNPLHAQTYYIDATNGNDLASGTSKKTAWQSLTKVNLTQLYPGDRIRLKCGEVFRGSLELKYSGTKNKPIKYSSYGACVKSNKPIISASQEISKWHSVNGEIFVTTVDFNVKQLFVDGNYLSPARFPDNGFLTIDKNAINIDGTPAYNFLNDSELVSKQLTSMDLIGANIHIRSINWRIEDRKISDYSSTGKLSWNNNTYYKIRKGYGYYLENKLWMLTKPGEWFYDAQSKFLYLWLPKSTDLINDYPDKHIIEATQYDYNFKSLNKSGNLTIDGLQLQHAAQTALLLGDRENYTIKNLTITGSGHTGLKIHNANKIIIKNNYFINNLRDGIQVSRSNGVSVNNNLLINTGTVGSALNSFSAINTESTINARINNNIINNTGYIGIRFGLNSTVKNNIVENTCMVLDDCGAIYSWNGFTRNKKYNSRVVNNVIINAEGNTNGRPPGKTLAAGIYLDDFTNTITVKNNTITNTDRGIFIHNAADNVISKNTLYGNRHYELSFSENGNIQPGAIKNNIIDNNIIFSNKKTIPVGLSAIFNNIDFAIFSNNHYSSIYSPIIFYQTWQPDYPLSRTLSQTAYTLPQWQQRKVMDISAQLFNPFTIETFKVINTLSTNFILNANFLTSSSQWRHWSATHNEKIQWQENCTNMGGCLLFTASPTEHSILISNRFTLQKNKNYLVQFKIATKRNVTNVKVVMRRDGPSYEDLGLNGFVSGNTNWQSHQLLLTANTSLTNARLDFETPPGAILQLDEISITEVSVLPNTTADDSLLVINKSDKTIQVNCPIKIQGHCNEYSDIYNQAIHWPISLDAKQSKIIIWINNPMIK